MVVGVSKTQYLPHVEGIIVKVLKRDGESCAAHIAGEMYPGQTNGELRAKTSQISVSLKRLEKKKLVEGEKRGRKNFFRMRK